MKLAEGVNERAFFFFRLNEPTRVMCSRGEVVVAELMAVSTASTAAVAVLRVAPGPIER